MPTTPVHPAVVLLSGGLDSTRTESDDDGESSEDGERRGRRAARMESGEDAARTDSGRRFFLVRVVAIIIVHASRF